MNAFHKLVKLCSLAACAKFPRSISVSTLHNNYSFSPPNPSSTNYKPANPAIRSRNYSTHIKERRAPKPPNGEASEETDEGLKLDRDLIHHLERTSLVDFDDEEALSRLEEAVRFANTIFEVDTSGVEPLISVLENEPIHLRDDTVGETSRSEILMNAPVTEEDYFVAPPGNIPLDPKESFKKENVGR